MALLCAHDMVQYASDILKHVKYVLVCLHFNKPVELHWGIWSAIIWVTALYVGRACTSLAPLISNTLKFNFIKIPQIFTTQRWIREFFLHNLPNLKLDQQNSEYRKAFSTAQSALMVHVGSRASCYSLFKKSSLEKKSASRLTELCWDYLCFKAVELLCDHLLCTLITDISSLTSGSKCSKAESTSFDPFPLDYRIICLASEHVMNYREGTWQGLALRKALCTMPWHESSTQGSVSHSSPSGDALCAQWRGFCAWGTAVRGFLSDSLGHWGSAKCHKEWAPCSAQDSHTALPFLWDFRRISAKFLPDWHSCFVGFFPLPCLLEENQNLVNPMLEIRHQHTHMKHNPLQNPDNKPKHVTILRILSALKDSSS